MVSSACYRADGTQVGIEGKVGRLCWFFIVMFIIGIITNILYIYYTIPDYKRKGRIKILIISVINIIIDIISIYYLYQWCKMCRGLQIYLIILVITSMIRLFEMFYIFDGPSDYMMSIL